MPPLNRLASDEQILCTPSRRDGICTGIEEDVCISVCQQIQTAGVLLRLPQAAMATAQVLFRRFWYVSSMRDFDAHDTGMGALFLAAKLVEVPLRMHDLLLVYDYLDQRAHYYAQHSNNTQIPPFTYKPADYYSPRFYDARDASILAEMQILKRLGFYVQVELPYAYMINYMQAMGVLDTKLTPTHTKARVSAVQIAWNYLTDALQTPVYCLFPAHTIACAAIYLLTLKNVMHEPLALPLEPQPWWMLFDVTRAELRAISAHIMRLYDARGPSARVRDERGGCVEIATRAGIYKWLNMPATTQPSAAAAQSDDLRANDAALSEGTKHGR